MERVRTQNLPAVVLGGGLTALSVARSLADAGISVDVLDGPRSPARVSRLVRRFIDVGTEHPQEVMLSRLYEMAAPAVVLAGADDGVELLGRHRAALLERGFLPMESDPEVLLAMLDKTATYALARRHGTPTPATVSLRDAQELEAALEQIAFPCILKPVHSHVFAKHTGGIKALFVATPDELRAQYAALASLGIEMFVTEVIRGEDDEYVSYFGYLDEHGETLFDFTKRKLRQNPPGFGIGTYHETTWNPEVADAGRGFLQRVGLRGLGNVEFKRDARDGRLKLIECNARFTLVNELVRRAGLDLALISYHRAAGLSLPPLHGYRAGVRLWDPINDARAFMAYRRSGALTAGGWLASLMHRQHLSAARIDDPLPAIARTFWMIGHGVRRGRPPAVGVTRRATLGLVSEGSGSEPSERSAG